MISRFEWMRRRRAALAAFGALALAAGVAVGCGGDDDGDDGDDAAVQTLTITASDDGLQVPESTEAGVTEITLTNDGEEPHSAQMLRVEGERDADEVAEAFQTAVRGEAFPDWFFAAGGAGTANPGETNTVTQQIEAGFTYWVVDDEGQSDDPPMERLDVTGEGDGELEETGSVITALDFSFEADEVTAGETITFRNDGEQPHHVLAVPYAGDDVTFEDVEQFFETEEGEPPLDFEQGYFSSVLEGGDAQVTSASLDAGSYALICFVSNREGGPPHAELGMIDELVVE